MWKEQPIIRERLMGEYDEENVPLIKEIGIQVLWQAPTFYQCVDGVWYGGKDNFLKCWHMVALNRVCYQVDVGVFGYVNTTTSVIKEGWCVDILNTLPTHYHDKIDISVVIRTNLLSGRSILEVGVLRWGWCVDKVSMTNLLKLTGLVWWTRLASYQWGGW